MVRKYLVGIDEVGRGSLAGPITVAAVVAVLDKKSSMKNKKLLSGIRDSKKLSAKKREEWVKKLIAWNMKHKTFDIAISSVGPAIIDRVGISGAARLAVGRCLQKFKIKNLKLKILLDGSLYAPRTYQNQETIIKGDEKIPLIATASIVAKVHRDKMMTRFHKKFPQYGFAAHKGYGTKVHLDAIEKYGLSPLHRVTFCSRIKA